MTDRSSTAGTKFGPMPWIRCPPARPSESMGESLGSTTDDLHVGIALLEHLPDPGDRAAGARTRDEVVDGPIGVAPDLLGRGAPVDLGVRGMLELAREHGAGRLRGDALRGLDRLGHALVRVGEHEFGAVGLQQRAPLLRHGCRHREDHAIPARRPDEGEGDAGVPARGLHDGAPRLQLARALRGIDERDAEAVLHAGSGVVELELREDFRAESLRDCVQPYQRGVAECRGDVGMDPGHGSPFSRGLLGQSSRRCSYSAVDR